MTKDELDAGRKVADSGTGSQSGVPNDPVAALNLSQIMKIPIDVKFVLACARLSVEELMQLAPNSTINTGARLDEKIDIVANGRIVARGEMVVVNEETSQIGIMVTEVVGSVSTAAGS